jgi:GH25 family lysozyme M1 (1,4-beta-N-acetylmuramidase)
MTRLRVVALAQALTMSLLLLPGPLATGPSAVEAALRPVEPDPTMVYDAAGKGIGCQSGGRKYRGPGLPKDPPWPPGAKPTPTPRPTPSLEPTAEPGATPESSEAPSEPEPEPEPEAATMAFVAADVDTVQAGPAATPRPKSKLITGIDVSHHNGDIDYRAVKDAGHRFVFIKATQDNDFIDPMFPTNMARARAAGLAAGAYHFFDYTLDGREQADHFIDRVEAAGGIDGALPPVVDVECWAPIGPSIHAVSAARLRDFVERVYERTGVLPLVYTSVFMWREVVGNAEGFEDLPLWAACWGCDRPISIAPGWAEWTFWQEGLTRIPGVGRLDGNYFDGSRKQLKALRTRPFSVGGGVAAAGGTVELDLGGRSGTHIRTSPDGETWTDWQPLRGTPTTVIGDTEGTYTVYAQLKNGPGLRSPVFRDSVVVDATPPELSEPSVWLRTGALGTGAATVPVTVRWEARDAGAGLADAQVVVGCGQGRTQRTEAPGHAEPGELAPWTAEAWLFPDATCRVTAVARDGAGVRARASVNGPQARVVSLQAADAVEADEVGVIARRGPDAGRAALLVDGESVALINLYAPEDSGPEVVHVIALAPGRHSLALEATGSSDPESTGTAVTVEGFATLTR